MKKIIRLEIENFQSHADTVLDLSLGLNVVVGPSDQGKSALVRSLRWVIYNEPRGMEFIRRGSSVCRVRVILDSGESITRERSNSKNRYVYQSDKGEEQIFEGFGNNVPLEITAVLQMPKIALDTDKNLSLNLSSQLESPFLLEESGAVRAKMIGRLTGVHIIDSALRQTIKDTSQIVQEEKRLSSELSAVKEKLLAYDELVDLEKVLSISGDLLDKGSKKIRHYRALQRLAAQLQEISNEEEENKRKINLFSGLLEAENLLQRVTILWEKKNKLLNLNQKMKTWKEEYYQLKNLRSYLDQTDEISDLLEESKNKVICLTKVQQLQNRLQQLELEKDTLNEAISEVTSQIEKAILKYQNVLQDIGQCPLCFTDLDPLKLKKIIIGLNKRG